ncbi:MAG TPA: mannose-1-phosphate guanylyltransferase [Firmicutes bacterium]|nr:mannose-1-phosphate guanylyltransferase [Bacillota bacterium]
MKIVALIMAGGRGERFYPASRIKLPKQFLCLTNDNETMIQKTVKRISPLVDIKDTYILTNEMYKDLTKEQLPGLPEENIILEPVSRNTAPAIELGVEKVKDKYDDALIIVLPSDHLIKDENEFRRIISLGADFAIKNNALITIGIKPNEPNTGYGYIHLGEQKGNLYKVNRFVEKPNLEKAIEYLNDGNYVWNAGMFIFTIKNIDNAFKAYMKKQYDILSKDTSKFSEVDSISIDYGIMEKANNIYVIPGDFGWDDVGSWLAIERINGVDNNSNTILNKDTVTLETTRTTVKGDNDKLIITLGVDNLIVVESNDVILVASKDKISDIKKVIATLKEQGKDKFI